MSPSKKELLKTCSPSVGKNNSNKAHTEGRKAEDDEEDEEAP
jgi:hypothetical protein